VKGIFGRQGSLLMFDKEVVVELAAVSCIRSLEFFDVSTAHEKSTVAITKLIRVFSFNRRSIYTTNGLQLLAIRRGGTPK
jgi:hypothetical protein